MKRSGANGSSEENTKKVKLNKCAIAQTWNLGESTNKMKLKPNPEMYTDKRQAEIVDRQEKKHATTPTTPDVESNVKMERIGNVVNSRNDDRVLLQHVGPSTSNDNSLTTNTDVLKDKYVVFTPALVDYLDKNESGGGCKPPSTSISPIATTTKDTELNCPSLQITSSVATVSTNENPSAPNENHTDSFHQKNIKKLNEVNTMDEIELVLLPTVPECEITELTNNKSENLTNKHNTDANRLAAGLGSIRQNTFTYSRVCNASNIKSVFPSKGALLNRVNIQSAIKTQPLMIATKKQLSEVIQPTAKVSIGNTTISVPLLKPLNSTQIIQSNSHLVDGTKVAQSHNLQPSSNCQAPVNKMINVKRSPKIGNQSSIPTIVSLSQLQIKPVPVSAAKIVQAKVVSKKIPLPNVQIPATISTTTPNNSIVAITAQKQLSNKNFINNQKLSQLSVVQDTQLTNKFVGDATPISETTENNLTNATSSGDNMEKVIFRKIQQVETKSTTSDVITLAPTVLSTSTDDKTVNVHTIKKTFVSTSTNITPPQLTPLPKRVEQLNISQQLKTNLCSSVGIINQPPSQQIKAYATDSIDSFTLSTNVDTTSKTDFAVIKSPFTLNSFSSSTINATPLIAIPRSISLKLTKSGINQQPKMTIATSNMANPSTSTSNITSKEYLSKQLNLQKCGTFNITALPQSTAGNIKSIETPIKQTGLAAQSVTNSNKTSEEANQCQKLSKVTVRSAIAQINVDEGFSKTEGDLQDLNSKQSSIEVTKKQPLAALKSNQPITANSSTNETICNITEQSFIDRPQTSDYNPHQSASIPVSSSTTDETHNVLLKQLLQNSSSSHNQSSPTSSYITNSGSLGNQVVSARKVVNVRAPSLGVVSSLEAQLARPVIPPVPTGINAVTRLQTDPQSNVYTDNVYKETEHESSAFQNSFKIKPSVHIISKETSFVSNPNLTHNLSKTSQSPNILSTFVNQNHPKTDKVAMELNIKDISVDLNKDTSPINADNSKPILDNSSSTDGVGNFNVASNANSPKTSISNTITSNVECFSKFGETDKTTTILDKNDPILETAIPYNTNTTQKGENITKEEKIVVSQNTYNVLANNLCINTLNTPEIKNATSKVEENLAKQKKIETINKPKPSSEELKTSAENSKLDLLPNQTNSNTDTLICDGLLSDNIEAKKYSTNNVKNHYGTKDVELRKKRKREYQKHRRQLVNSNKHTSFNLSTTISTSSSTSTSKRKPKKILKIEEDFDNFTDNLMTHIRQMQPLQVLEPLLNRNFNFCSLKEKHGLSTKEINGRLCGQLLGEYGNAQQPHHLNAYEVKPISMSSTKERKDVSIQNDFYDQEFSPIMQNDENIKATRFVKSMCERNIEVDEVINNKNDDHDNISSDSLNSRWNTLSHIPFLSLIVLNNATNKYLGRMSPTVPFIDTMPLKISKLIMPLDSNIHPQSKIITEDTEENCLNNRTIILTLSASACDNIFGVLRDLANILHISQPSTYEICKTPKCFTIKRNLQTENGVISEKNIQGTELQQMLNGRRKICRNCGQCIKFLGVRGNGNIHFSNIKTAIHSVPNSIVHTYYCNRNCYGQYRERSTNLLSPKINKINTTENDNSGSRPNNKHYKYYNINCFSSSTTIRQQTEKDLIDMLHKMETILTAKSITTSAIPDTPLRTREDMRQCIFCCQFGDGTSDGPSRLLNFEVDRWVHLNCALWSNGVYETISGALMNFKTAVQFGLNQSCCTCQQLGATVKCFKARCSAVFHLPCAIKDNCVFYKNKTVHCQQHAPRSEKENELDSLVVKRRVFVDRDENQQVVSVMHHSDLNNLVRIGSITFLNVGQLLPHQFQEFHNAHHIYPIGYKISRMYWSMRRANKRCRYICSIAEVAGRPEFRIQVQEPMQNDFELRDTTPTAVWNRILEAISTLRKDSNVVQLFPKFLTGEDLFGLTEPTIIRIIESLPGVETLPNYRFKYGRNPLLELPLAVNPSGAARTEPKPQQFLGWRKPHTQRTVSNQRVANPTSSMVVGEVACPYSKQFVHSKSSQYKKMKQEWRNNVYLARSKIQGLGLYAARDMEKHTMIIEYIGEVIRTEVSELREKQYEAKNRGIYMFRLDEDRVVDATLSGGLARYINHSCNPNCVTEIVDVDREFRIIIFAKRRISRGEELSYDYKFDIEDDAHKISCMCGAPNCRKWMN